MEFSVPEILQQNIASFSVREILQLNIASQDSDSDDDVSALSGSDSDILETVESRFCRILGR